MTDREKHRNRSLWRAGCLAVVLVLVAGLATLALTYRCWLSALGSALALDQPPVCADAIVAVSGNNFRRELAMDLYQSGYAGLLIFNVSDTTYYFGSAIDPVASILEAVTRRGIPRDSMVINTNISSTFEDALAARETVCRLGLNSLLVVTSYFSSRRTGFAYRRAMEGMELNLFFCSVPLETEKMSLDGWWTRERELVTVVNEYLKLIFYYFKY